MVRVKICGITAVEDALLAVEAGADALGFVFHVKSPRNISPENAKSIIQALPPFVQTVGLFVNSSIETINDVSDLCGLDLVQLHGDESPEFCTRVNRRAIKAFRIKDRSSLDPLGDYRVAGYLLDAWVPSAYGGTGHSFNWELAVEAKRYGTIILAGGLTPENIRQAVAQVAPYGVDVSSGVECAPGRKDPEKVREFVKRAKMP
jgi:phosphoribosylanthranilate isomerase